MAIIESNNLIDLDELGKELRLWFINRKWTTTIHKECGMYAIEAEKKDKIRITFSACRALVVVCMHKNDKTQVSVKQGSWAENIASNVGWFFLTGGANLAFTGWSIVVQKQFEGFVKETFTKLSLSYSY